jgi:transposase-like protein
MKPGPRLTSSVRREITLRAMDPETNITYLAEEYGITRSAIHQYLNSARRDPEGALEEAIEELEFRRDILEMYR